MNTSEFNRLSIEKRLDLLKADGDFIGSRRIPSHHVYLYSLDKMFIELYVINNLNQIQWIEVQTNKQILAEYTRDIDLKGLFD
jgi:hypothetical protein|tara:strand:+ start:16317 stop:16565 length:249 start_codon:yes stop_codon:yes gene_type:complete